MVLTLLPAMISFGSPLGAPSKFLHPSAGFLSRQVPAASGRELVRAAFPHWWVRDPLRQGAALEGHRVQKNKIRVLLWVTSSPFVKFSPCTCLCLLPRGAQHHSAGNTAQRPLTWGRTWVSPRG